MMPVLAPAEREFVDDLRQNSSYVRGCGSRVTLCGNYATFEPQIPRTNSVGAVEYVALSGVR